MQILIIGGTRNIGHFLTLELLRQGHEVSVLNRGKTPDELPAEVQRLQGDRSDPIRLAEVLTAKSFDAVIDMALYNGSDAETIAKLLDGRIGHYVFVSTGQIYLVRQNFHRPFREEDDKSPLIAAPQAKRDYEEWLYGIEKNQAEEVLREAFERGGFPVTTLRLPMVNSERDHFHRVHHYFLRLQDGGPILLPTGDHLRLRHVYGGDVVQAITRVIESGLGKGRVYNISQDETLTIQEFLSLLAEIVSCDLKIVRIPQSVLEEYSLLPDCSPFSDPWMSELDNARSKLELGMQYTSISAYLQKLAAYYQTRFVPIPAEYQRRHQEIELAMRR